MEDDYEEIREIVPVSRDDRPPPGFAPAAEALPGLARVAASAGWHTAEWGVRTTARAGRRVMRAATDPVEAAALARDATEAAAVIGGLARAVSSGVMATGEGGAFQLTRPVTGAEAVATVQRLEALAKSSSR